MHGFVYLEPKPRTPTCEGRKWCEMTPLWNPLPLIFANSSITGSRVWSPPPAALSSNSGGVLPNITACGTQHRSVPSWVFSPYNVGAPHLRVPTGDLRVRCTHPQRVRRRRPFPFPAVPLNGSPVIPLCFSPKDSSLIQFRSVKQSKRDSG